MTRKEQAQRDIEIYQAYTNRQVKPEELALRYNLSTSQIFKIIRKVANKLGPIEAENEAI